MTSVGMLPRAEVVRHVLRHALGLAFARGKEDGGSHDCLRQA